MPTNLGFGWESFHRMVDRLRRHVPPGFTAMTFCEGEYIEVIGHPYGTINRWSHSNDNEKRG